MELEHLYNQTLQYMENTVHSLASRVSPPKRIPYKDSFVYRYQEKTIHQALVQKLARLVTGLRATQVLMETGFTQEQGAMQRVLDEITEDISYLAFAVINNEITPSHEAYLAAFFQEEFDPNDAIASSIQRAMVPRQKIRAYVDKISSGPKGSSKLLDAARTVSKTYSGYIHAASPQIMDMYWGTPGKFHMNSMLNTPRHDEHRADLWNYYYRGICAFVFAAKAFGDEELFKAIREYSGEFSNLSGKDYQSSEWDNL